MENTRPDIIPSHNIDKQKWDACIHNSSNPLIYAYSFYLDQMADNWHGIIINDYKAVMPVCWRKKWGIRYAYDVPFIQQCGWFQSVPGNYAEILIKALFSFCRYGNYSFNYNCHTGMDKINPCTNYILDLSATYNSLKEHYSNDLANNLKKATREAFIYTMEDHHVAIDIYRQIYHSRMPHVSDKDFDRFIGLCNFLYATNEVVVRKVCNSNNELLATALLLKDKNRLYNLMNSTTAAGRKTEANHFLFDNIFKEFAGSQLIFDFEGSDIPGVKSFYEKFGAVNQPYYKLHFNHLPFPLNKLKR